MKRNDIKADKKVMDLAGAMEAGSYAVIIGSVYMGKPTQDSEREMALADIYFTPVDTEEKNGKQTVKPVSEDAQYQPTRVGAYGICRAIHLTAKEDQKAAITAKKVFYVELTLEDATIEDPQAPNGERTYSKKIWTALS